MRGSNLRLNHGSPPLFGGSPGTARRASEGQMRPQGKAGGEAVPPPLSFVRAALGFLSVSDSSPYAQRFNQGSQDEDAGAVHFAPGVVFSPSIALMPLAIASRLSRN